MVNDVMAVEAQLETVKEALENYKLLVKSYRTMTNKIVNFVDELTSNKAVPDTTTVDITYVVGRLCEALGVDE
jgi:hypothetical protein